MPAQRSWLAWKRLSWMRRLCGVMPEPSTVTLGVERWIASWRDTRASPSASPANAAELRTRGTCGYTSLASFEKSLLPSATLRTSPTTYVLDSLRWRKNWERWAIASRRDCSRRLKSALRIYGSAFGSLPTPTATDYGSSQNGVNSNRPSAGTPSLTTMARTGMWPTPLLPTPTASDADASGSRNLPGSKAHSGLSLTDAVTRGDSATPRLLPTPIVADSQSGRNNDTRAVKERGHGTNLAGAVEKLWRTPNATDWKRESAKSWQNRTDGDQTPRLSDQVGGQLNPTWVEWLMGWPLEWTAYDSAATVGSHWWERMRSALCSLLSPERQTDDLPLFAPSDDAA